MFVSSSSIPLERWSTGMKALCRKERRWAGPRAFPSTGTEFANVWREEGYIKVM